MQVASIQMADVAAGVLVAMLVFAVAVYEYVSMDVETGVMLVGILVVVES